MAPVDLLLPLAGQREETLRVIDSLTEEELWIAVRGERSVLQVLVHLVQRERAIDVAVRRALRGERLSPAEREQISQAEEAPAPDWDLGRIRRELVGAREALRETFDRMKDEDLDLPIRWPEWPVRTIRGLIPYMLEHEDSHMDELREAIERERRTRRMAV